MLYLLGVILAAAFYVTEWNDITERLTWTASEYPVRARWRTPLNQIAYGTVAVTGISRLIAAPWRALDSFDWLILCMFVWSALSMFWSTDRRLTARALGGWLAVGCAVFGIRLTCTLHECVVVVATGCLFYFLAGVVHEIASGRVHFSSSYRFFGGVGCNRQGAEALLMLFLTIYLYQTSAVGLVALGLVATYTVAIIILARSRTATWASWAAFLVWFLASLPSAQAGVIALGLFLAGLSLVILIPHLRRRAWKVFNLGRKQTELKNFSGRTIIWRYLLPNIRQHPILGFGYGSFWIDARHYEMSKLHPFFIRIAHAHSVYLDSLLNGGLVALLLLVSILGMAFFHALQTSPPLGSFMLAYLTYSTIHGLGESTLALPLHRAFAFYSLLLAFKS